MINKHNGLDGYLTEAVEKMKTEGAPPTETQEPSEAAAETEKNPRWSASKWPRNKQIENHEAITTRKKTVSVTSIKVSKYQSIRVYERDDD